MLLLPIVYFFGSSRDELVLDDPFDAQLPELFNLSLNNCIVKLDETLENVEAGYADFLENQCQNCINGTRDDALFVDVNEDDYHLDTLSIAEMQSHSFSRNHDRPGRQ